MFCPHPLSGIEKAANAPQWGLKIGYVNKLQIPYLWEVCNNLIKLEREAPYANRS